MRSIIHMTLHFIVPLAVARVAHSDKWKKAWFVLVCTMLVDLDHLLAQPIFNPGRCSIGFHPLHSYPAIAIYLGAASIPSIRLIAIGLLIHMLLDGTDCYWMFLEK